MRIIALQYFVILGLILYFSNCSAQPNERNLSWKRLLRQANLNIQQHRKGDFSLAITDAWEKPMKNVEVNIMQSAHTFHFGAIIFELTRDDKIKPKQKELFKKRFFHLFNYAVLPFYWAGYESQPGHPAWYRTEEVIDCGLLEKDLSPKPVYHTLDRLINNEWKTSVTATTDNNGMVSARGFYGTYDIIVHKPDGTTQTFSFSLLRGNDNRWAIQWNE
jgi:hypothetical protein